MDLTEELSIAVAEPFLPPLRNDLAPIRLCSIATLRDDRAFGSNCSIDNDPYVDLRAKRMTPAISRITPPNLEEFGSPIHRQSEEVPYMLSGALELHAELNEPVALHKGSLIYLDSMIGHASLPVCDADARVLAIVSSHETIQSSPSALLVPTSLAEAAS